VDSEPSDEELRTFAVSMLSTLDKLLREPEVIDQSIREHREMWMLLYHVSQGGFDVTLRP
jgi:hypothetical protein